MPILRIILLLFLGLASVAFPHSAQQIFQEKIAIAAEPIAAFEMGNPSQTRFGSLDFRGGLVLSSSSKSFGGLSAMLIQRDGGTFLSLSDRSYWLRGRILYRDNRPAGISDAVIAPILDASGVTPARWDTESIAEDGGTLFVGIEDINRIARFDYANLQLLAPGSFIDIPNEIKSLPKNQGLEALVFVPKPLPLAGALIAISERGFTEEGNIMAFIIGGPKPGAFSVKRSHNYDISDAALLPDGDLLILERAFSLLSGISVRIRRVRHGEIMPGATIDGRIIFEADMRFQIDNMEALAVHRSPNGEIILTLLSDDNQSIFQRTLLLQFALKEP